MLPERFHAKVRVNPDTGCHEWVGAMSCGYGSFWLDGRMRRAHRVAYEDAHGEIPLGHDPDHLCRNKRCVNVAHIEVVTHAENGRRCAWAESRRARTHCRHGHEYTPANTMRQSNGSRRCRTCQRNHKANYLSRQRSNAA